MTRRIVPTVPRAGLMESATGGVTCGAATLSPPQAPTKTAVMTIDRTRRMSVLWCEQWRGLYQRRNAARGGHRALDADHRADGRASQRQGHGPVYREGMDGIER